MGINQERLRGYVSTSKMDTFPSLVISVDFIFMRQGQLVGKLVKL